MKNLLVGLVMSAVLAAGGTNAATVTANVNVDNGYFLYLSTSDTDEGTYIAQGRNWEVTRTHSATLTAGVTNYMHIYAIDLGGLAGFLGEFTISDTSFAFENGTQTLLSGDAGLRVSETGWENYGATTELGANGVGPWGNRAGVSSNAKWVWSDDATNDNEAYFTLAINAVTPVPLPATLPLLLVSLGGLGFAARRFKPA